MKSKLRLCRTLCSSTVLLSILCFLGLLECLHWLEEWRADGQFPLTLPDQPERKVHSPTQPPQLPPELLSVENSASLPLSKHPTPKASEPKKLPKQSILLLAYARSGSSFTGELLSASRRAAYYYEPLFSLRPNGTAIENVIMRDPSQSGLVKERIAGIYGCSWPLLKKLNEGGYPSIRKRGLQCRKSNPRVIKTIRLRRAGLEPWVYDTDIKVVHLVRDPRAMITSIARRPGVWSSLLKNSTFQCQRMEDDMKLEQGLPKERYVRVRYEDLVDKTEETLEGLYNHLGLLWTDHVRKVVWSHTHAEAVNGTNGHGYYNTFRSSNFAHDSWKRKLGGGQVAAIEQGCRTFMEKAGYAPYQGPYAGADNQEGEGTT